MRNNREVKFGGPFIELMAVQKYKSLNFSNAKRHIDSSHETQLEILPAELMRLPEQMKPREHLPGLKERCEFAPSFLSLYTHFQAKSKFQILAGYRINPQRKPA